MRIQIFKHKFMKNKIIQILKQNLLKFVFREG